MRVTICNVLDCGTVELFSSRIDNKDLENIVSVEAAERNVRAGFLRSACVSNRNGMAGIGTMHRY
jgi:hypothetical protein